VVEKIQRAKASHSGQRVRVFRVHAPFFERTADRSLGEENRKAHVLRGGRRWTLVGISRMSTLRGNLHRFVGV
jgi:hypothetical protein